jgi:hypothetical protein
MLHPNRHLGRSGAGILLRRERRGPHVEVVVATPLDRPGAGYARPFHPPRPNNPFAFAMLVKISIFGPPVKTFASDSAAKTRLALWSVLVVCHSMHSLIAINDLLCA